MKKTLSLLLVLAMVLSSFGFAFAAEDEIVPAEFLNEKGILKGNAEGNLMLEDNLKRQDMVVMLSRLLGVEEEAKAYEGETTFTDIADPFYVPYIAWAEAEELTEGVGDNKFGFDRAVKENEVVAFLLRALGYTDVAWEDVPAKAVELGLVEKDADLTVDAKREVLANLTYKALGMKMKDSEKTLAEHLEIEMPVPEVLEVEEVVADNLKEIKVVFNKSVDESVLDIDNYETDAGEIVDIAYDEEANMAILALKDAMKNKKDYELAIDGIKDLAKVEKEFTAYDNIVPVVEDVVALGTKAIKVTMSEPIKKAEISNFKLDGKTMYGSTEILGRSIIIKPYKTLEVKEYELTVGRLEDYAEFRSLESKHTFEVVEDKEAPTVEKVEAPALEKLIVTFSEDVDSATVNKKTVYYKDRGTKIYPNEVKRLAGNKFAFIFTEDNGLPLYETTIYIEGVADYSGNKMAAAEVAVKASVDETRPEVKEVSISVDRKIITVEFTKLVNIEDMKVTVLDDDSNKLAISEINPTGTEKSTKVVKINLGKALVADEEYTLKITGVKDTNKYPNYMADYSEKIATSDLAKPNLDHVVINLDNKSDEEVAIYTLNVFFDKDMDLSTISNPANYLVEIDDSNTLLSKLDNEIVIKDAYGRRVEIKVFVDKDDDGEHSVVTGIAGLDIKGDNGKGLANYGKIVRDEFKAFIDPTVTATAKDTVEVEFNNEIKTAPVGAFELKDASKTYKIEDTDIDGNVVTLKLENKLPAATANVKLTITKEKVAAYNLKTYDLETELDVVDEIAPSIEKVEAALVTDAGEDLGKVKITVTFDEIVKLNNATEAEVMKFDLEVRRNTGDAKIENYTLAGLNSNEVTITIDPKDVEVNKTKFTVIFKGLGLIGDNVDESNKLAKVTKETNIVDNILKGKVDAAKTALVLNETEGNITLPGKLDDVTITWAVSTAEELTKDGENYKYIISRPSEEGITNYVTLTATLKLGDYTDTKAFKVSIPQTGDITVAVVE